MSFTQRDSTEIWDRNADVWREHFGANDLNRKYILDPAILNIIGDAQGKRILDAGCGEGYLSRILAARGAYVVGVEVSAAMLDFARKEEEQQRLGITYHHGDITHMSFLSDSSFDIVVTNVVIDDVQDFEAAFRELFRLLKPGGVYVQATVHPCFGTLPGGWAIDGQGKKLYKKVDNYFEEGSVGLIAWPSNTSMEPTVAYFRTLSTYFNTLVGTGFAVERLVEPRPSPEAVRENPRIADELRVPNFLIMVCRRPT